MTHLRPPKTLLFNGYTYTVDVVDGTRLHNDSSLVGKVDLDTQNITLASGCGPVALAETFLHEILHVCYYDGNLRLTVPNNTYETEEIIVNAIARTTFGCLISNPELLEYFLAVAKSSKQRQPGKPKRPVRSR